MMEKLTKWIPLNRGNSKSRCKVFQALKFLGHFLLDWLIVRLSYVK